MKRRSFIKGILGVGAAVVAPNVTGITYKKSWPWPHEVSAENAFDKMRQLGTPMKNESRPDANSKYVKVPRLWYRNIDGKQVFVGCADTIEDAVKLINASK